MQTMTESEYRSHPAISSTDVKKVFLSSVYHWAHTKTPKTPAMEFGSAVHDLILEGGNNTICGPETRRGNAWKIVVAENEGKIVLPEAEYDKAFSLAVAVKKRHKELQVDAITEACFFAEHENGLSLKCKPDRYFPKHHILMDVKTTTDASSNFIREIYKYRYDIQAAFYKYVVDKSQNTEIDVFRFIAIEKEYPYASNVFDLTPEALEVGKRDMEVALKEMHFCNLNPTYDDLIKKWDYRTDVYPPSWISSE